MSARVFQGHVSRRRRHAVAIASAVLSSLTAVPSALAQDIAMGNRYRQSAEVLARYPSLDLALDTPALSPGRTTLTTQEEMESYLLALTGPDQPVVLKSIAKTTLGRNLPLLVFTPERLTDPAALTATGRPIVWLIGQQHGNEPAGGEAMLALARELSRGRLRPLLDKLVVVMVPRANPDGAAADTRDTALRMDLNRDHATLALSETRAIHAAVQSMLPDLVVDAHEFSVAQRWIEKFGGLQAVDLMMLEATHPAVPDPIKRLARDLFVPAVDTAAARHGLRTFPYHTTSTRKADRAISMGGNAPGIARNAFGLMGAVSFLLETRGVGIGMESYQRRVATHVVAIEAMLTVAAANAADIKTTVAKARAEASKGASRIILGATPESETITLPLVDPQSGAPVSVDVVMANSRKTSVTLQRPAPAAYIILPEAKAIANELRLFGLRLCTMTEDRDLDAEMFEIAERAAADRRAINPDAAIKATVREVRVHVPAGSLYVPMNQPMAHRAAAALEPDAPGSFVALDVVRVPSERTSAPIVRVPRKMGVPVAPGDPSPETVTTCSAHR